MGLVKVTVTGAIVPGTNGGMITFAFTRGSPALNVSDRNPVPAFTWSTVTVLPVLLTPNEGIPPGNKSPSATVLLQTDAGSGVGVGVAVGVGVGVGVRVGALVKVTSLTPSTIPNSPVNLVHRGSPGTHGARLLVSDVMPETNVPAATLSVIVTVEP